MPAIFLAAFVPLMAQPTPTGNWVGAIRAEILVEAPGYVHQETQTWTLTGAAPTTQGSMKIHPATWTVQGEGSSDRARGANRRTAKWTTEVPGRNASVKAPVAFVTAPVTGALALQLWHAQLTASGATTGTDEYVDNGIPTTKQRLAHTVYEWQFPRIEGEPGVTELSGTRTLETRAILGPLQPADAVVSVTCSWALGIGNAKPLPPPTLPTRALQPGATLPSSPGTSVSSVATPPLTAKTATPTLPAEIAAPPATMSVPPARNSPSLNRGTTAATPPAATSPAVTTPPETSPLPAATAPTATALPAPGLLATQLSLRPVNDSYFVKRDTTLIGGPFLVKSFKGRVGSNAPTISDLKSVDGRLFFSSTDPAGVGLWKSDGTPAGTVLLKAGAAKNLTAFAGRLFFAGHQSDTGTELWSSDGTPGGTTLVKDILSGAASSHPSEMVVMNNALYFFTLTNHSVTGEPLAELWKTDGSPAGTTKIATVEVQIFANFAPIYLTQAAGRLYFLAGGGGQPGVGLWKSDGTAAGTQRITTVYLPSFSASDSARPLAAAGGHLFFRTLKAPGTNADRHELWKTDGTPAGTVLLLDVNPTPRSIRVPMDLTPFGSTLFFTVLDCTTTGTRELWRSNGTPAGTVLIKGGFNPGDKNPMQIFPRVANGLLYFRARGASGGEGLWRTDGTATGTMLLKEVELPLVPWDRWVSNPLSAVSGTIYFAAHTSTHGRELWQSDGTLAGTKFRYDILPGTIGSDPGDFADVNGTLYFSATNETQDILERDLWAAGAAPSLIANDSILGPTQPETILGSSPTSGTVVLRANGSFCYRPNPAFTGSDSFTYTLKTGTTVSSPSTVTIAVQP
jgi:ELWxxDGT repeat protein